MTGATIGQDTTTAGSKEREIEPRPPDGGRQVGTRDALD
jgi:hypothetical protein